MAFHDTMALFLIRRNKQVLVMWLAVFAVACYNAPELFKSFEMKFVHTDDTESGRAANILKKGLPDYQDRMEDVVVVWCDDCQTVVGPESRKVMDKLSGWLDGVSQRFPGVIKNHESYYDLEELGYNPYISPDKKTMLFHWSFKTVPQIREAYDLFNSEVQNLNAVLPNLNVVCGGPYSTFRGSERIMFRYIAKDNLMVMPFIVFILWFMLGSLARSTVPFVCTCLSVGATWTALLFVKKFIWTDFNMVITLPFVTAAFAVALCVDYGLFLWARFGEERSKGVILEEAIALMIGYSGHVVAVSGSIMMLAYISIMFYPHANEIELLSLGMGNSLAAFFSVMTSMTLTPSLIAAFPQVFDSDTSEHGQLYQRLKPGRLWKKWAVMITRPPWIVLVPLITYLAIAPVALQLQTFQERFNTYSLLMAHMTPEYAAFHRQEDAFPKGTTSPMMVVLQLQDETRQEKLRADLRGSIDATNLLRGANPTKESNFKLFDNPVFNGLAKLASPLKEAPTAGGAASFLQTDMWQQMADTFANSQYAATDTAEDENLLQKAMKIAFESNPVLQLMGGKGRGSPFSLQVDDKEEPQSAIRSKEFFKYSCALIKTLIQETQGKPYQIDASDILSVFWLPPTTMGGGKEGKCIPWELAQLLLRDNAKALESLGVPQKFNFPKQYAKAYSKLSNDENQVSALMIRPKFDPMGVLGSDVTHVIREKVLPKFRGILNIDHSQRTADSNFFSTMSLMMDVQARLYGAAPRILGATILAMFIAISCMFRSAFVPMKLCMTVVVPLTFVYGAAVAVYQNGALDWLGIDQLHSMGGLSWEMPLFTFCVLMGLALDYDIFLFARVYEYRQQGYDNRSAVVKGMASTGPIISAAGSIMALAFSSNMMGPFGYDNQIGFIMFVGVLVDTFVIRMCLVPCFLCMLEGLNYWPVKMPAPTKIDKCTLPGAKDSDFDACDDE